jgi:hypothetical protein
MSSGARVLVWVWRRWLPQLELSRGRPRRTTAHCLGRYSTALRNKPDRPKIAPSPTRHRTPATRAEQSRAEQSSASWSCCAGLLVCRSKGPGVLAVGPSLAPALQVSRWSSTAAECDRFCPVIRCAVQCGARRVASVTRAGLEAPQGAPTSPPAARLCSAMSHVRAPQIMSQSNGKAAGRGPHT